MTKSNEQLYIEAEDTARKLYRDDPDKWNYFTEEEFVERFTKVYREKLVELEVDYQLSIEGYPVRHQGAVRQGKRRSY